MVGNENVRKWVDSKICGNDSNTIVCGSNTLVIFKIRSKLEKIRPSILKLVEICVFRTFVIPLLGYLFVRE